MFSQHKWTTIRQWCFPHSFLFFLLAKSYEVYSFGINFSFAYMHVAFKDCMYQTFHVYKDIVGTRMGFFHTCCNLVYWCNGYLSKTVLKGCFLIIVYWKCINGMWIKYKLKRCQLCSAAFVLLFFWSMAWYGVMIFAKESSFNHHQ